MKYTKPFSSLSRNDSDIAGGKGASLGEMTQAGIPVPPGFVILSGTFDHFIHATGLIEEIDAALHKVDHKAIHSIDAASETIEALIKKQEIPEDIKSEITGLFNGLGSEFVAVRSSATAEDGAENAWAGQLESYLNTTEETLFENIKNCWASLFTPRAIFYRFEKGLETTKISVAVVVQKMVNSEKSGIAFSVHPVTEDYNQIIIEAGFGLGEAIVSGSVTPDSYVVEKEPRKIVDVVINNQARAMYRKEGGGNEWRDLSSDVAGSQALSEKEINEFADIVMTIENHYGFPCDIEWAFDDGKFYITQSRPITTLKPKTDSGSETKVHFHKTLERDLTFISQGIYVLGMKGENYLSLGKNNPNSPSIFLYEANGYLQFWENPKFTQYFIDQVVAENLKGENFIQSVVKEQRRILEKLSEYWKMESFEGVSLIPEYIELMKRGAANVAFYYHSGADERVPANIREQALSIRTADDFFAHNDEFLRRYFKERGYDERLSSVILADEIENIPSREILEGRANASVLMEGTDCVIGSLQSFKLEHPEYIFDSLHDSSFSVTDSITGSTSYPGTVTGLVRIVRTLNQVNSLQDGEVLVSAMTTPDFISAMKKASAFVTDEGGIMCHASIIAREMKKPCITATKIATQILQDGDEIEVDATNGIVRILKRAPLSPQDLIQNLATKEWHFIHKRTRSPFYTGLLWSGISKHANTAIDFPYEMNIIIYLDTHVAVDNESWERLRVLMHAELQKNPNMLFDLIHKSYAMNEEIESWMKSENTQDLSDPAELLAFWNEYKNRIEAFGSYLLLPLFIEPDMERNLKNAIIEKFGQEKLEEVFQVLTTPIRPGAAQEEELGLLKLAIAKKNGEDISDRMKQHLEQFSWITNNSMTGVFMTSEELHARIEHVLEEGNVEEKQSSYLAKIEEFKNKFQLYRDQFTDSGVRSLIDTLQESIYFRSWRTERYYRNAYFVQDVIKNTAHVLNLKNPSDFFFFSVEEIIHALETGEQLDHATIESRKKGYMGATYQGSLYYLMDSDLETAKKSISVTGHHNTAGVITGQPAFSGKVSGKACVVISKTDLSKVQEGDIIVSPSTTVDYVPVLKKVVGIVTEEGGVLSHASVISRELHIPCVIGTKIATQVIKDGDMIEVDAERGVVTILSSAANLIEKYHFNDSTWTYKGFHGVLHTFFPVGQGCPELKKHFDDGSNISLFFAQDDYIHWFWNDNDLTRIRELFLERLAKNKNYLEELKAEWRIHETSFKESIEKVEATDLSLLSDSELSGLYEDFYTKYVNEFRYFLTLGDGISMHADRYLIPEFKKILGERYDEVFPVLTSTKYKSFIDLEYTSRMNLYHEYQKNGTFDPEELKKHADTFFYIQNNYAKAIKLSTDDFEKIISAEKEILDPSTHTSDLLERKEKYMQEYDLSEYHKTLLYIIDEFFKLQDDRKKYVLISNYYQFAFLQELSKRTGIDLDALKYSVFPEYRTILASGINIDELLRRKECSLCIWTQDGYEIFSGTEAEKYLEYFQKRNQGTGEIKGIVASVGKVTGRVKRILKIHDMANMEEGDILVASMTRPEMVPVMKLAAAIVTDEGGITCHAAIVSRELKIPCIIGTKNATQILKDGDIVEVDATTGIVRII